MIEIQKINFPSDCIVELNNFYNYDPVKSFNEADNIKYLSEDLLQLAFPEEEVMIDLGWYGDIISNKGEYKIYIIKNENWEIPFNIIHSKSVDEIQKMLIKIIHYYTRKEFEPDL